MRVISRIKAMPFLLLSVFSLTSIIFGEPAVPQKVSSISVKEDLTIGVREGDENYMFGNSIMVNADDRGNIYVTDWDKKLVRKYDPSGRYLLTMGRRGQGPGEFTNISVVRFDREGNPYVLDFASRKIVLFDRNGKYLDQKTLTERFGDLQITPAGTYLCLRGTTKMISGMPQIGETIGIFDAQFKPIVELRSVEISVPPPPKMDPRSRAESISREIFSSDAYYALGQDGRIYFGHSAKYSIDVYTADGKKVATIGRDIPAPRVEKHDRDDYFAFDWDSHARYIGGDLKKQVRELIRFPEFKPFFLRLVPMENGWLAVAVDSERNRTVLLDLFDQEGRFLGRIKAAVPMTNLFFKNGKAYAVVSDEGYLFVKRYTYRIQ